MFARTTIGLYERREAHTGATQLERTLMLCILSNTVYKHACEYLNHVR